MMYCCSLDNPLHEAIAKSEWKKAEDLLKSVNDWGNSFDRYNRTPLRFAIEHVKNPHERYKVCKLLTDHNARVDFSDSKGREPLHYLLDGTYDDKNEDNQKLFDLLIEKGADVNCRDVSRITPLSLAIRFNALNTVRKLLKLSADPYPIMILEFTVMEHAIMSEDEDMVKVLLESGMDANNHAAVYAAVTSKKNFLQLLFKYGASVDNDSGRSCCLRSRMKTICRLIFQAIRYSKTDALEVLLEMWVDMDVYNTCHIEPCILSDVYQRHRNYLVNSAYQKCTENMVLSVVKHVAVLTETDDRIIVETASNLIAENEWIRRKFDEYVEQIRMMKKTLVRQDSDVSYFDLMARKRKALEDCCDQETISSVSKKKLEEFPEFKQKLMRNIEFGVSQRYQIDCRQILYETFDGALTYDIICHICDYFKPHELISLQLRDVHSEIGD